MATTEWLGKSNVVALADTIAIPLGIAEAVTFVCYLDAGDTFTVQEDTAAGGVDQDLDVVDRYHTGSGVGGVWTLQTQTADAAVTIAGTANLDCAVFTVFGASLTDGFVSVNCTATGAGVVTAIVHDMSIQRAAANLPALV
jgi:hypothetical protein